MKKKLLALFTALVLLLSAFSGAVFAEGEEVAVDAPLAEETTVTDFYGEHDEAIKALIRFGILDEEGFDAKAKVSRGDFLGRAMHLTGAGDMVADEVIFSDVPTTEKNAGA